jgi:glycosyltransferase involved in cell wall biosynthesis
MRIAFFISRLGAGGAERQAAILCCHWAEQGHDVLLVTNSDGECHYPLHPAIRRHNIPVTGLGVLFHIRRVVRDERRDVAISFMDTVNVKVLAALLGTGVPVVVSERNVLSSLFQTTNPLRAWIFGLLRHLLYPTASALVVQSNAIAEEARKGHFSRHVHIIPNVSASAPPSDVTRDGKTVLAVGRLLPQKGHDVLIRAFALVTEQFPDWRVKIVGTGPGAVMLENLAQTLNVRDLIEFAPVTRDIWRTYQEAEIFVLPSRFEGFPNVLVEAMQAGCPAIVSDGPGAQREIVTDGFDGLMFTMDAPETLARQLVRLMTQPETRQMVREHARQSVGRYKPEAVLPPWDDLLEEVARVP